MSTASAITFMLKCKVIDIAIITIISLWYLFLRLVGMVYMEHNMTHVLIYGLVYAYVWTYANPMCVVFVSCTSVIIINHGSGAITDDSQSAKDKTHILSPSCM